MNYFFKNKTNIVLTCLLCGVIACGGVLGYMYINKSNKIIVPDFTDKTKNDVETWCKSLENNPCTINTDYSDTIEKDKVIYQSINNGQELTDKISFIISLGKNITIELPDLNNAKKEDIENWASDNGVKNINFVNEKSSDIEKDYVIRIEPNKDITIDTSITVYISIGEEENTDNTIAIVSGKYIDLSVDEFEKKMKSLGLNPVHSEKRDDFSSSIDKDKVVWHGSGDYIKDETIHYGLSLGDDTSAIKVEKGTYVGLTLDEFTEKVKSLGTEGLVPEHNKDWDEESSEVAQGDIVFHGYGAYVDGENIRYGLSLGIGDKEIVIKEGQYVGKTYEEYEKAVKGFGLVPTHKDSLDVKTSDEALVGKISKNGYGTYEKGENCSYGLYVSNENTEIVIKLNQYVGKTYSEFETAIKSLGLVPYHRESWDETTSDENKVGKICFNGSGTYTKGENCSYGLYLGKTSSTINIKEGQYVGKTESEFKSAITTLGLSAVHNEAWDTYSDSVAKGSIVRNGYGDYTKGESCRYGLSLGSKPVEKTITINANAYNNLSESDFKSTISSLGLSAKHNTNKDAYSSVTAGNVIYHDSGSFSEGSSVSYGVSLGTQKLYLNSKNFYNTNNSSVKSFNDMKSILQSLLSGFTNISYEQVQSADNEIGMIEYIKVNGSSSYDPGYFNSDTPIVIGIVSAKKPS